MYIGPNLDLSKLQITFSYPNNDFGKATILDFEIYINNTFDKIFEIIFY